MAIHRLMDTLKLLLVGFHIETGMKFYPIEIMTIVETIATVSVCNDIARSTISLHYVYFVATFRDLLLALC